MLNIKLMIKKIKLKNNHSFELGRPMSIPYVQPILISKSASRIGR